MSNQDALSVTLQEKSEDVFDVNFLKQKGIETLQELTGQKWSDFNVHDPGITTLEILCFALTELGYRSKYNIEDLFFQVKGQKKVNDTNYLAHEILSSGVVTENDLKKVLLDIDGVNNVEFIKSSKHKEYKGIYDVFVELQMAQLSAVDQERLKEKIHSVLISNRMLSTMFKEIVFFESEELSLDLIIELNKKTEESDFVYDIIAVLENYFSGTASYKTLDELLEKKVGVESIYSGPLLKNGFLSDDEIQDIKLRKKIYTSDIINVLMSLEEVNHLKKIVLHNGNKPKNGEGDSWFYVLKKGKVPRLNINQSKITLTYKGRESQSLNLKDFFSTKISFKQKQNKAHKSHTIPEPKGELHDLKEYHSILNDFPELYGLSEYGLHEGASVATEAYTKQFRAYLLLFDQVMANYFAKLDGVKNLFSLNDIETTNPVQVLKGFTGDYSLYKPFLDQYSFEKEKLDDPIFLKKEWSKYLKDNTKQIEESIQSTIENQVIFNKRRGEILDHLLARFGYDYSAFDISSQLNETELISLKKDFLKNLISLGLNKQKGAKDSKSLLERDSGFEQYLRKRIGLKQQKGLLSEGVTSLFSKQEKSNNEVSFSFNNARKNLTIENLFQVAHSPDNYQIVSDIIQVLNLDKECLCKLNTSNLVNDQNELIHKIASKFAGLSADSEGIYMLEHLLIKPDDEMPVFGFQVMYNDQSIFQSDYNLTHFKRDEALNVFFENSTFDLERETSNYSILELDMNQFKIVWSKGEYSITGTIFFESRQRAQREIEKYEKYFKTLKKIEDQVDDERFKDEVFVPLTKFTHHYNEIVDPFSNIVSFILPSWPYRFQNEAFKNHIEEIIHAESPAHVVSNICWFSYDNLTKYEEKIKVYTNTVISNLSEKETLLDEILSLLASN